MASNYLDLKVRRLSRFMTPIYFDFLLVPYKNEYYVNNVYANESLLVPSFLKYTNNSLVLSSYVSNPDELRVINNDNITLFNKRTAGITNYYLRIKLNKNDINYINAGSLGPGPHHFEYIAGYIRAFIPEYSTDPNYYGSFFHVGRILYDDLFNRFIEGYNIIKLGELWFNDKISIPIADNITSIDKIKFDNFQL